MIYISLYDLYIELTQTALAACFYRQVTFITVTVLWWMINGRKAIASLEVTDVEAAAGDRYRVLSVHGFEGECA